LAAYRERLPELTELGITVIAASVDPIGAVQAMAVANRFTFPLAFGLPDEDVAALVPEWCNDRRGHYTQPMEFLVAADGTIAGSLYASGGVGCMEVGSVIELILGRDRRADEADADKRA
jgi:peroxiredoxin